MNNCYKKAHVVHLVNDIGPAGKEKGIIKLMIHLDQKKFKTSLIVLNELNLEGGIKIDHLNTIVLNLKRVNDPRYPIIIAKLLKKLNADIVHTHSWATLVEGVLGGKIARVPVIIHGEHGTFPQKLRHKYSQFILWYLPDRVLSVSENLRQQLSSFTGFPSKKIEVILNGVEDNKFYPSPEMRQKFYNEFNFSEKDFIVGTVGRFAEVKNHPMIIKACSELIKQEEEIHVIFIGDGEKKNELKSLVLDLGLSKYVHFLGVQSDINLLLNGMDIFTLTSFNEGCSNVIQEAMFCAKPVISTNVGGNPELIKNNFTGLLVQSNDHIQLAEKILYLKKNVSEQQRLGENARKYALEYFSLQKMISNYSDLYLHELHNKKFRK